MYTPKLRVHLIDTPGFDDTMKKDVEVLRDIAGWLVVTYQKRILLSGLIYLHPISDNRLRGSAKRNLFMFKKLCGPECLRGIVLATTMWGLVDSETGNKRENELRGTNDFWGEMEQGGSLVMRHLRTKESGMAILDQIIRKRHPMLLMIQDEMIRQGRGLEDTGAGINVNEELIEADRKHKKELAAFREDMKEADEASKRDIAELMRKQEEAIEENRKQRKALETNMAKLEAERAADMKRLEDQLAAQAARLEQKDKDIKNFKRDMERREKAHALQIEKERQEQIRHSEEREKAYALQMEKERQAQIRRDEEKEKAQREDQRRWKESERAEREKAQREHHEEQKKLREAEEVKREKDAREYREEQRKLREVEEAKRSEEARQHREEQARWQAKLQDMEKQRAKETEALQASVAQAERQSTGMWTNFLVIYSSDKLS